MPSYRLAVRLAAVVVTAIIAATLPERAGALDGTTPTTVDAVR